MLFYIVNVTVILTNESYYIFKASKKEKEKVKRLTLDINKRLQEDTWKQAGKYWLPLVWGNYQLCVI